MSFLKKIFRSTKNFKLNSENFILILLGAGFFAGIWHALPLTTVINDEQLFVGSILRAMENLSLMPNYLELPYGILTYFINYLVFGIFLFFSLPFFHLSPAELKIFLMQSPEIMYLLARLISAVLALGYLFIINKFLKKEIADKKVRLFLLILLFTNMLTILILHTVKVWVLGMLLVILSFYYLYRSICPAVGAEKTIPRRNIFLSIIFAFLATANFSLNVFTLINIPIIFYFFRQEKKIIFTLIKYSVIGFAVYLFLAMLNFAGFKTAVESIFVNYAPAGRQGVGFGVPYSLFMNFKKILLFCPLLLLTLVLIIKNKVRNKNLLIISLSYFTTYLFMVSLVATWANDGIYYYIRYIFPFSFFLIFIIASFDIKFKKVFIVIASVSLVYYLFTLYFLSVPTTYNQAKSWAVKDLNNQNNIVYNSISTIQFEKNKASYLITKDYFCASKCRYAIANNFDANFKPLVIDEHAIENYQAEIGRNKFFIIDAVNDNQQWELIKKIGNGNDLNFSVEGKVANYFDFNYFRIKNFGPEIYIYRQK